VQSAKIELRAHPAGQLLDGVVGLRRYAGQEVEDVLRARITSTVTSTPPSGRCRASRQLSSDSVSSPPT
jgi:hypothetical protein